jgi:hypothetical protein
MIKLFKQGCSLDQSFLLSSSLRYLLNPQEALSSASTQNIDVLNFYISFEFERASTIFSFTSKLEKEKTSLVKNTKKYQTPLKSLLEKILNFYLLKPICNISIAKLLIHFFIYINRPSVASF